MEYPETFKNTIFDRAKSIRTDISKLVSYYLQSNLQTQNDVLWLQQIPKTFSGNLFKQTHLSQLD